MTLCLDIVTRAFRKIGVSGLGQTLDATTASEGMTALNMMMTGWTLAGIPGAVVARLDMNLTDSFPLEAKFEEGTVYILASRLSPDYMVPASFDSDDWFRKFQAEFSAPVRTTIPAGLRALGSALGARR